MRAHALALPIVLSLLLAACGGGGDAAPSEGTGSPSGAPQPTPAIALDAPVHAVTVVDGAHAAASLTLARTGGAAGAVQLSIDPAELPAGVTATFSANPMPAGAATGTLTLQAAADAPAVNAQHVHVHAQLGDTLTSTLDLLVTVAPAAAGGSAQAHPFDTPTGTPITLPAGLTLDGIVGMQANVAEGEVVPNQPCAHKTPVNDASRFVELCLDFGNSTGGTITVTLPPGLIFLSDSSANQNGVVTQTTSFVVPAGGGQVVLRLYCGNGTRFGSHPGDRYTLGPVSNDPLVTDMTSLLANRQAASTGELDIIQGMVWLVSDHGTQTDAQVHQALAQWADALPLR